jgi:uncharacterized surface protein with fasciclin (FAS1) repeats
MVKATTVNGEEVTVHLKEGKVFINDAEVVLADVTTKIMLYTGIIMQPK